MTDYTLELSAYEGFVEVVPSLTFSIKDSGELVIIPYGLIVKAIENIESNIQPDDISILEFEADNRTYRFEFPPGPPADDALRVLKWFRDAIEFAGPLNLHS